MRLCQQIMTDMIVGRGESGGWVLCYGGGRREVGVSVSVCSEGEKVGERWKEEGAERRR